MKPPRLVHNDHDSHQQNKTLCLNRLRVSSKAAFVCRKPDAKRLNIGHIKVNGEGASVLRASADAWVTTTQLGRARHSTQHTKPRSPFSSRCSPGFLSETGQAKLPPLALPSSAPSMRPNRRLAVSPMDFQRLLLPSRTAGTSEWPPSTFP